MANCKKSCKYCQGGSGSCQDLQANCGKWAAAGYCGGVNKAWMQKNCQKTCQYCWEKATLGHTSENFENSNSHKVNCPQCYFEKKNLNNQNPIKYIICNLPAYIVLMTISLFYFIFKI